MTTYSDIANTEVDADSPLTADLGGKFRDNPLAILEGDSTAISAGKTVFGVWTIDDGAGGVEDPIWDFSVDGAFTTLESPTFSDGYEYRLIFDSFSWDTTTTDVEIEFYGVTDAAYEWTWATSGLGAVHTVNFSGVFELGTLARFSRNYAALGVGGTLYEDGGTNTAAFSQTAAPTSYSQKFSKVRIGFDTGAQADAGKIYLLRRGEYLTK